MTREPDDPELALLARLRGDCLTLLDAHPDSDVAKQLIALFEHVERELRASPEQAATVRKRLAQLDLPPDST